MARTRQAIRPAAVRDATGIALYVRMASIFRANILRGDWPAGQQIPTILELCQRYGVARVTVRQALHLLAGEGLLSSQRGKGTFVSAIVPKPATDEALKVAINDPLAVAPGHTIRILRRERVAKPPPELVGTAGLYPSYVRLRKVHFHRDTPFCVMDIYIAAEVFDRFPRGAEKRAKVARLMRDYSNVAIAEARQRIRVGHADHDIAALLACDLAAAVAIIERDFIDKKGRVIWTGTYIYRGDLFVLESRQVADILKTPAPGWMPTEPPG